MSYNSWDGLFSTGVKKEKLKVLQASRDPKKAALASRSVPPTSGRIDPSMVVLENDLTRDPLHQLFDESALQASCCVLMQQEQPTMKKGRYSWGKSFLVTKRFFTAVTM